MSNKSQLVNNKINLLTLPQYKPTNKVREILMHERICLENETPQELLERVVTTLFSVEDWFETNPEKSKQEAETFAEFVVDGYIMPGSSTLTNAGRSKACLSSCAIIPINLQDSTAQTERIIRSYYRQNMGSGFEFSEHEDPMALLNWLNELSARETATGKYERYIGNMGTLHVNHPHIREFIDAKRYNEMAYFNISVNVTEEFMERAKGGELFRLSNELEVSASELFQLMAESAWQSGEPGLIFLERMNKDNPLSEMSGYRYTTTPPCAEMGLVKGETCHFGYINLYKFIKRSGSAVVIDYDKLREATRSLTRALDNAIEYSLGNYPVRISADIAGMKRKIGIGVCGLADLLIVQKLPYDSEEARRLARDILSFVNYVSKWASVELANERGSCMAMAYPDTNKYLSGHYLEEKYAETEKPTRTVSSDEWRELADTIRSTRKLRNISTTALPPTGRTAILLETSSSIEPLFSLFSSDDSLQNSVLELLSNEFEDARLVERLCQEAVLNRSFQCLEALPLSIRACLKTAKEISASGHLKIVADIAGIDGVIDESASKTVNLPQWVTVNDVRDIFIESYNLGLKNISVYRDKTKAAQPENLS